MHWIIYKIILNNNNNNNNKHSVQIKCIDSIQRVTAKNKTSLYLI